MLSEEGKHLHNHCVPCGPRSAAVGREPRVRSGNHTELWLTRLFPYRLFGFLLGSTLAGASVYYYILEEYKVSNEMLTEDIYVRYCI